MSINAVKNNDGDLRIENEFYTITLERRRGGAVGQYITKKSGDTTLYREGCEIWDRTLGPFHPFHYQQEQNVMIDDFVIENSQPAIRVKVKSPLGINPNKIQRGIAKVHTWCVNNWLFQVEKPVILCYFEIGHDVGEKVGLTKFKKYVGFDPNLYTHWACKKDDGEIVSGAIDDTKQSQSVIHTPPPKWMTYFNNRFGVALFLPDMSVWSGIGYGHVWRSREMAELTIGCDHKKERVNLSIGYLAYQTTQEKKWRALEEWLL